MFAQRESQLSRQGYLGHGGLGKGSLHLPPPTIFLNLKMVRWEEPIRSFQINFFNPWSLNRHSNFLQDLVFQWLLWIVFDFFWFTWRTDGSWWSKRGTISLFLNLLLWDQEQMKTLLSHFKQNDIPQKENSLVEFLFVFLLITSIFWRI